MTDFLKQLAAKSLAAEEVLRPRLPSLFEPIEAGHGQLSDQRFQLTQAEESFMPQAMELDTLTGADALLPLVDRTPEIRPLGRPVSGLKERSDMPQSTTERMTGLFDPNPKHGEEPSHAPTTRQPDAGIRKMGKAQGTRQIPDEPPHPYPAEPATQSRLGEQVGLETTQTSYAGRDESEVTPHYRAVLSGQDQPQSTRRRPAVQHAVVRAVPGFSSNTPSEPAAVQATRPVTPVTVVARPQVKRSVETPFKTPDESLGGISTPKPAPTIQVTIGRVEVRAMLPAALPTKRVEVRPKTMSLDDYLKQRSGERR